LLSQNPETSEACLSAKLLALSRLCYDIVIQPLLHFTDSISSIKATELISEFWFSKQVEEFEFKICARPEPKYQVGLWDEALY
jgi:hypothetical protein